MQRKEYTCGRNCNFRRTRIPFQYPLPHTGLRPPHSVPRSAVPAFSELRRHRLGAAASPRPSLRARPWPRAPPPRPPRSPSRFGLTNFNLPATIPASSSSTCSDSRGGLVPSQLILGSSSVARKHILEEMGLEFQVMVGRRVTTSWLLLLWFCSAKC